MSQRSEGIKLIASNPAASMRYFIQDVLEAGVCLLGTEVKSLRCHTPSIREAYVEIRSSSQGFEAWLLNAHIVPYSHGNIWNHEPRRQRKLLLHRRELRKLFGSITQKGMALIATRLYFKKGKVKVELGLGKGKKQHDRRETLKRKTIAREVSQAMKSFRY